MAKFARSHQVWEDCTMTRGTWGRILGLCTGCRWDRLVYRAFVDRWEGDVKAPLIAAGMAGITYFVLILLDRVLDRTARKLKQSRAPELTTGHIRRRHRPGRSGEIFLRQRPLRGRILYLKNQHAEHFFRRRSRFDARTFLRTQRAPGTLQDALPEPPRMQQGNSLAMVLLLDARTFDR